ncbi:MAG: hypothetical protein HXS54_06140 [Theionarchaea archaeon]|nr:hypothetical protein [Theionarchaea archaeon]DBA34839.1 TPA_asm: hypothetical protein vir521_00045 [Caudoviricetes sp. vir521]
MITNNILKDMLQNHGAEIEDHQLLAPFKEIKLHGYESAIHRLLKCEVYHTALKYNLYPFMEVPMSSRTKDFTVCDLLIEPLGLIIQVENCTRKKKRIWEEEYYDDFKCKIFLTEITVLDYIKYKKIPLELWQKEIEKDTPLFALSEVPKKKRRW